MSMNRTPLRAAAALLCAAGAAIGAGSAQAASGSLTYVKGGDVYLSAPDGSRAKRLTRDGGYAWPSQADTGLIVAVRQTSENGRKPRRLHKLSRTGRPLGAPLETVRVDNADFVGPLAPQVSPDGTKVAYHYFSWDVLAGRQKISVGYTSTAQGTEPGVFADVLAGYLTPSWTADGRVLVFYANQRTSHVGIDTLGGDYLDWFGDLGVETLLTDGELSRAGDRLVAVGDQNDLRFYAVGGTAQAPELRCVLTGFQGAVSDPTWSPDGQALAWEDAAGIHVGRLGDLAGCQGMRPSLVVAKGTDPDWGPAAAPARKARRGGR